MTTRDRVYNKLIGALQAFRSKGRHHDSARGQEDLVEVLRVVEEYAAAPKGGPAPEAMTPTLQAPRRVVCAAIRAADGSLLLGIRHYSEDMHEQIRMRTDGARFKHRYDEDQGFVDQHGAYMNREEAYRVADAARQIAHPEACGEGLDGMKLYSQGLY